LGRRIRSGPAFEGHWRRPISLDVLYVSLVDPDGFLAALGSPDMG
jgi:hypothetical protein